MAVEIQGLDFGDATANADLSAKQFYAVKVTAAGVVDVASGATDVVVGILQTKAKSGDAVVVRFAGVTKWACSATINPGDRVGTANDGRAVAKTADGDNYLGVALRGGAVGELCEVILGVPIMRGG